MSSTLSACIFRVQDGSVASLSGLTGGLQIMSVNNIIFAPTTTHHDAIMALTSSSVLNISVKVTTVYSTL